MFNCLRLYVGFIFVLLSQGCNRQIAPSISSGPIAVTWDHLRSEPWRYELESETTISEYGFNPSGHVSCTLGSRNTINPAYSNKPMDVVRGIVCEWEILGNGDLMIREDPDGEASTILRLSSLGKGSATVIDFASGKSLLFSRTYTKR